MDELRTLLAIPSVSADPARKGEVLRCAHAVAALLRDRGLPDVRLLHPREGHPAVLGRTRVRRGRPTVLVYGHYDVQPEDPVEAWTTPPFEPTVRDGRIYARGATDNKGQFLAHVMAVTPETPVNLVFLIEGEEEIGSRHLPEILQKADLGGVDVVVVSDTSMPQPGQPALVYGLRGVAAAEVEVPPRDAWRLVKALALLHDADGRVTLPGFYDRVRAPVRREQDDEEAFRRSAGVVGLCGERGWSALERRTARPTLDVNGLCVDEARAFAKITCRLVPDQDPREVAESLRVHLQPLGEVNARAGGRPWLTEPDHPALEAAARALEAAFGRPPVYVREGGSIPAVVHLEELLHVPMILMGLGLPGENLHAPDEHFHLENYERGIRASAMLMAELARR